LGRRDITHQLITFSVQILQKLGLGTFVWMAGIELLVATASGQDRILPELPQASTPVTLVAARIQSPENPNFAIKATTRRR
jgi:hypothetical protein